MTDKVSDMANPRNEIMQLWESNEALGELINNPETSPEDREHYRQEWLGNRGKIWELEGVETVMTDDIEFDGSYWVLTIKGQRVSGFKSEDEARRFKTDLGERDLKAGIMRRLDS